MAVAALAFVGASIGEAAIGGALGAVVGGALGGGIGAEASGGDFWQGALSGGISSGLGATDFLGMGESMRGALGGIGLSEGASGMVMSGLQGGLTSVGGGGNFLEGALAGAVMPSAISGAKDIMGWGTAQPGQYSVGSGSLSAPTATGTSLGFDGSNTASSFGFDNPSLNIPNETGMSLGYVGNQNTIVPGVSPASSAGNFLSKFTSSENLLPTALSSGANMYMNQQNAELAKSLSAKADPYAQYRPGDAAAYNALLNNPNAIFDDPVYQAMAKQGDEAIMRQAAAMGKTDSGELTNRISENRMALADSYYRNRLGQYGSGAGVAASPANAASVYGNTRNTNYLYGAMTSPLDVYAWERGRAKVY